jgi:hypothetical protein
MSDSSDRHHMKLPYISIERAALSAIRLRCFDEAELCCRYASLAIFGKLPFVDTLNESLRELGQKQQRWG